MNINMRIVSNEIGIQLEMYSKGDWRELTWISQKADIKEVKEYYKNLYPEHKVTFIKPGEYSKDGITLIVI